MKRRSRIAFAALSFALSLPAFGAIFVGFAFAVLLSGFQGTLTEAAAKLALGGTLKNVIFASSMLFLVGHVCAFCYLLTQFAKAKSLPLILQAYCLLIVIGVLVERIRLISIGDESGAFFWFGLFSLPHALALMSLLMANVRYSRQATSSNAVIAPGGG